MRVMNVVLDPWVFQMVTFIMWVMVHCRAEVESRGHYADVEKKSASPSECSIQALHK